MAAQNLAVPGGSLASGHHWRSLPPWASPRPPSAEPTAKQHFTHIKRIGVLEEQGLSGYLHRRCLSYNSRRMSQTRMVAGSYPTLRAESTFRWKEGHPWLFNESVDVVRRITGALFHWFPNSGLKNGKEYCVSCINARKLRMENG